MKNITSLFTGMALLFPSLVWSQNAIKYQVNGKVQADNKAIEAATVSLMRAADSAIVKQAISAKDGQFVFAALQGKYRVAVKAVGYSDYYSDAFDLTSDHTVKAISLKAINSQLSNVTVVSKRPLIEQKLDKTIMNVDASPTNTGLSALDILEKAPGVTLDKDGNISLKGKQGVLILLDGRPTYLSGTDLVNLLRGMPGGGLDQIEIMTNPPAKYDASGNSGVINIKTKKIKTAGFNGNFTLGYGQGVYPKSNNSINLNYRTGKFNFFANGAYNYNKSFQKIDISRKFGDSTFKQHSPSQRENNNYSYKVGVDYFMSKKTTLGIVVNGYNQTGDEFTSTETRLQDKAAMLYSLTEATNDYHREFNNIGANINLRHVFDTTGKELTSDIDYVHYNSANRQYLNTYFYDNAGNKIEPDELLRGNLPAKLDIYSYKADYTHPLKKGARFEAGVKTSFVTTDNNALYDNWDGTNWQNDVHRSNHFKYTENVNAAYVNFNKEFNKQWSLQTGLRLENTIAKGRQLTTGEEFKRNYTQLFPTVYIGYKLNDKNEFALSYGRRIDRPDYEDLNPFYHFLDKYTYEVGNPYLQPQFSHNIELGHTFNNFLTTTLNYSTTRGIITDVLSQVDSTTTTFIRKDNIAKQDNMGISVSMNAPIAKWWKANIYMNTFYNKYSGIVNGSYLDVDGVSFTANINNQFVFTKGWSAELSGFYRTTSVQGVLVARPMGALNIGVSKQVLKNKGSIRLNCRDFLNIQVFKGYSKYQNIDVDLRSARDSRVLNLSFTYRFGKGKPMQQRKKGGAGDEQSRVKGGGN